MAAGTSGRPLAGNLQVKAKLIFILLISLPPVALTLALIYYIFQLPLETLVYTVPGIAAYLVFSFSTGIFFDLRRPPVAWQRFARQGNNGARAFVVQTAGLVVLGFIGWSASLVGMSPFAAVLFVIELVVTADLLLVPRLLRFACKRYRSGLEA